MQVQPHNCGGPISTAACVQLCAATPNALILEWFPFRGDGRYDIVTDAFEPKARDGRFAVPDAPGLGVELNEAYLAHFSSLEIVDPA